MGVVRYEWRLIPGLIICSINIWIGSFTNKHGMPMELRLLLSVARRPYESHDN